MAASTSQRSIWRRHAPPIRGRSLPGWLGDYLGCTMPRLAPSVCGPLPRGGVRLASIELWNGDICDLEVDAIVNPANLSLWMATGVGGALKRAGGDAIEFAAVRQAPVPLGGAVVTTAGTLAARAVIHAVSLDRDRRTSGPVIESAVRSAMARAREIGATSIAFPALGTGVGGFPLDEAAQITVDAVREELDASPGIEHVIFALRGTAAYQAFSDALHRSAETIGGAS